MLYKNNKRNINRINKPPQSAQITFPPPLKTRITISHNLALKRPLIKGLYKEIMIDLLNKKKLHIMEFF